MQPQLQYVRRYGVGDAPYRPYGLRGGVGDATATAQKAVSSGLLTAAKFDPEPISKALLAIGGMLSGIIFNAFRGCGESCTMATEVENSLEVTLKQNLDTYLQSPVHTKSLQAQAVKNFDDVWNAMVQKCGQIGGTGGHNCITDRQPGACVWKATPSGWNQDASGKWTYTYAGQAGSGNACWNWYIGYRDPIAKDPTVVDDPSTVSTTVSSIESALGLQGSGLNTGLLLGGAVLALALLL